MRHRKSGRKLGRNSSHRKALERNILKSLFQHGKIVTTITKAKEYAPMADKLITLAKRSELKIEEMRKKEASEARGEVSSELEEKMDKQAQSIRVAYFRRVLARLQDKKMTFRLFQKIAPLYADRDGGYTSVLKLGKKRLGDNAQQAVLRLVVELPREGEEPKDKKAEKEKLKKDKAEKKRKAKLKKDKDKLKKDKDKKKK